MSEIIKKNVREYVVQNFMFGDVPEQFSDSLSFLEMGIIDSTGVLELVAYLESQFNVQVKDDELIPENLDSVDCITQYVVGKQENSKIKAA